MNMTGTASVIISGMYLSCDRIIVEHNQRKGLVPNNVNHEEYKSTDENMKVKGESENTRITNKIVRQEDSEITRIINKIGKQEDSENTRLNLSEIFDIRNPGN